MAEKDTEVSVDLSFFTTDEANIAIKGNDAAAKKEKKSRSRTINENDLSDAVMINPIKGADVAETDYQHSYNETTSMLRTVVAQADMLSSAIQEDIENVRSSKTIKNKYGYITDLTSSAGSLLSTKVTAIRAMADSVTNVHKLNMDRMKALKLDQNEENDDKRMMDIYSSFVNAPIGSYNPISAPTFQDMTAGVQNSGNVNSVEIIANNPNNGGGLTPEQNRMRMESNPNIKTVVVYNNQTGQRRFEVIDTTTGMAIPNYPRPDEFLLEDTVIDVHGAIARNRNINTVWPLVVEGSGAINEY